MRKLQLIHFLILKKESYHTNGGAIIRFPFFHRRKTSMTKLRRDAWTEEEDLILVDMVLNSIRTGEKRQHIWEKASNMFGRTEPACAFRWNGFLSKKYESAIEQAKMQYDASKSKNVFLSDTSPVNNSRFRKTPTEVAMDEALEKTRSNRRTAKIEIPTKMIVHPNTDEVTTGIQQAISIDTLQIVDDVNDKDESKVSNPFEKIIQYVKNIEKEHDGNLQHYEELEKQLKEAKETIVKLQNESMDKDEEIHSLKEQLDSLNEIKELVVHFQNMNK